MQYPSHRGFAVWDAGEHGSVWPKTCGEPPHPQFTLDLFGEDSSYLMDILFLEPRRNAQGEPKARLLVLEDAGELVAADARAETGQALSRLLNVSDGLLGQGLNLCTLITTNEPIDKLHPAVLRPGRCAAQVEVPLLDVESANHWLEARDDGRPVSEPITVAELFARIDRPADAAG